VPPISDAIKDEVEAAGGIKTAGRILEYAFGKPNPMQSEEKASSI